MEKVRAKFTCNSVENFIQSKKVKFTAVYGKEGENADFTKYTPCGTLEMCIENDAKASTFFNPGEDYYLDFINTKD